MEMSTVIKTRRKELGYTLAEIAKRVGVSEGTVQRWESGNIKNLRHERISKLAEVLEVSPAALMGWSDETDPEAAYAARQQELEAALKEMSFTVSDTNPQLDQIIANAQKLNADGQQQLADYSDFLVASGKYEKTPLDQEKVKHLRRENKDEEINGG